MQNVREAVTHKFQMVQVLMKAMKTVTGESRGLLKQRKKTKAQAQLKRQKDAEAALRAAAAGTSSGSKKQVKHVDLTDKDPSMLQNMLKKDVPDSLLVPVFKTLNAKSTCPTVSSDEPHIIRFKGTRCWCFVVEQIIKLLSKSILINLPLLSLQKWRSKRLQT